MDSSAKKKILIVLPVYNEQLVIEKNALLVRRFCRDRLADYDCRIIIADNNSSDNTAAIARRLGDQCREIGYSYTPQKGKGNAWRGVFLREEADIYIVMDADLAVALEDTLKLVQAMESGADLAVGSRYLAGSKISRPFLRQLTSVAYRGLVRIITRSKISDFQCGFKALNKRIRDRILPLTRDNLFFLDTEITLFCEQLGYQVKEVPVDWSEYRNPKRKSTVKVAKTVIEYLIKIYLLKGRINSIKNSKNNSK